MEIVNQIAFMSLLIVLMTEVGLMVNALISALTRPPARFVRTIQGEMVARKDNRGFTPAERGLMFVYRWFYLSPCLHQLHCMAHKVQPEHKGTMIMVFGLLVAALAHALGAPVGHSLHWGAFCGLVVFLATQSRGLIQALEKTHELDRKAHEVV